VGPKTSISGAEAQLKGTLNLLAIGRYLTSTEAQTGQFTGAGVSYTLALEPAVHVSGVLGSSSVVPESFNPSLSFAIEANEMQLNTGQSGSATETLAQLVHSSAAGSVSVPRTTSANLSFVGLHTSVSVCRQVAAWILLACILALLGLGILLRKASGAAEADRIGARYGSILVAVERPEDLGGAGSVRVANVEDLVKIAEQQGRMILYCEGESERDYFVRDQTLTYLYSVLDQASGGRATQEVVPVVIPNNATSLSNPQPTREELEALLRELRGEAARLKEEIRQLRRESNEVPPHYL
jgi:hypothetical protein